MNNRLHTQATIDLASRQGPCLSESAQTNSIKDITLPRVALVILNWHGWRDTIECLDSIAAINYPNFSVVVVDNGSQDESVERIREHLRKCASLASAQQSRPIHVVEMSKHEAEVKANCARPALNTDDRYVLVRNDANYGFAEGNNIGIQCALRLLRVDYVFLLNNDTVVDPRCLEQPLELFKGKVTIGAIQSRLLRRNDHEMIDSLGQALLAHSSPYDICSGISSRDCGHLLEVSEIFGSCAAASFYRTETLQKVGLFDRDFFALLEDVDLSWRIRLGGYSIYLAPESVVYHKGGISRRKLTDRSSSTVVESYYTWANRLFVALTYYSIRTILEFLPTYILYGCLALTNGRRYGKVRQFFSALVKVIFVKRKVAQSNKVIGDLQKMWIVRIAMKEYCHRIIRVAARHDFLAD